MPATCEKNRIQTFICRWKDTGLFRKSGVEEEEKVEFPFASGAAEMFGSLCGGNDRLIEVLWVKTRGVKGSVVVICYRPCNQNNKSLWHL